MTVRLPRSADRSYTIGISPGMLHRLPLLLAEEWGGRRFFVITDDTVGRLYGKPIHRVLSSCSPDPVLLSFPAGEQSKDSRVVTGLHTALLRKGIERDSIILALGGGVVGDVAGFVAATILRGIRFIQIPTTLLAQVDSSVGGKVGVDHPLGKNLIGAFHQPAAVFIDPEVLRTLPPKQFRSGLAESVKIAAALDRRFFRWIEANVSPLLRRDPVVLTSLIRRSVALKAAVVERDERESGLRKILNVGHTVGHALESALQYRVLHGSAVAIGIAAETSLAVRMGLLRERERVRIVGLLRRLGLPTTLPRLRAAEKFRDALVHDKKAEEGNPKFVLLNGVGRSAIGVDVPWTMISDIFERRP